LGAAAQPILSGVVRVGGKLYSNVAGRLVPIAETAAKGGAQFTKTESIAISGSKATEIAKSYEAGVQGLYKTAPQPYTTTVNGQTVSGIADGVITAGGQTTAIEAKFVGNWSESIRNPASPIGNTPWAIAEQQAMVNQAAKYTSYFEGGVIYHTNSAELATYYSQVFKDAGITNFKFVITPVK
jgi:filamentous hemagglutinin